MTTGANTIERKDLIPFATYKNGRTEYIRKIIAYKNVRRVKLGQYLSLLFENRQTVFFQIQELVYSEDLTNEAEIDEYIEIFSGMLPAKDELSATLFIEIDDQKLLEELLVKLKGIEHTLYLEVGGESIQAVFEEEHDDREFTTSVHYLKFPLTNSAKTYLTSEPADHVHLRVILDHPILKESVVLAANTVENLQADLR